MKATFAAALAAAGIAISAPASAIVVGGIDFGALGNTANLETATLAETYVGNVGDKLQGYGYITTVNGSSNYCAGGGTCSLYYYFHDYTVTAFNGSQVQFTGGVVDIYKNNAGPINLLSQGSAANVAAITAMNPWVRLVGHTFADPVFALNPGMGLTQTLNGDGTLTGASLSQKGAGQLDSDLTGTFGLAAVAAYLNGNSIGDNLGGFADVVLTSSSNNSVLNPFDTCGLKVGDWCLQGTLNTRGATVVPEPESLALMGLGLFALVAARRKKRA